MKKPAGASEAADGALLEGTDVPVRKEESGRFRHLVFYHIPRTGGSSIWHALAIAAATVDLPVVDLFYLAQRDFGAADLPYSVLEKNQVWLQRADSLIHLHTPHNIGGYLREENIVYTTIVRDPIDRFISDICHLRRALPSFSERARHSLIERARYQPKFVEAILGGERFIEPIVELAAREPFFQNYYYFHFYGLLCSDPSPFPEYPAPTNVEQVRYVAKRAKDCFAYVGRFPNVGRTFRDIASRFGLPQVYGDEFGNHLNGSESDTVVRDRHKRFGKFFDSSYELLHLLGIDFTENL